MNVMSTHFNQATLFARASGIAVAGLVYASTAAAECTPGIYDSQRGLRIGDCYAASEMNAAMKNFGQRTFLLGKRIPITGKRYAIAGREYTDREVIDMQVKLHDDGRKIASMQSLRSEYGISEDAAWAKLKPVVELNTLVYRKIAEQAMHIRLTTDAEKKMSFLVEGNAPVNSLSTEFRILAAIRQANIVDPAVSGAVHERTLGSPLALQVQKTGERLMWSGTLNGQLFFLVRDPITVEHGDLYTRKPDGSVEDLGHIAELEYTEVGSEILKQLRNK